MVGSSWREVDYIKGLPKLSTKPATIKQLGQRAKFVLAVNFLQPVKKLLNIGFMTQRIGKATGYNIALQYFLANAVLGTYPDFEIDYSKVVISKGGLGKPLGGVIEASVPGSISLKWSANLNEYNSFADDVAFILVYNVTKDTYISNPTGVTRGIESATIPVPAEFAGDTVEAWMFFTSRDQTSVSNSEYIGSAILQ